MKIEVFPWGSVEQNVKDIKGRQAIKKEDLEKAAKILADCVARYNEF